MKVRAHGHASFLVGGVDLAVEPFGGVGANRQQPDVIDHDQVGAQDPADGFGDRIVGAVPADQHAELFEGEPGDVPAGLDGGLVYDVNLAIDCLDFAEPARSTP